jgi:acetyl-CoA carboxylase carboxyltransferase component
MNESNPREPSKLDAVREAHRQQLDEARPVAVARHKAKGRLTARENIADFLDADTFVEYGMLARPARQGMEGPADGLVMGTGLADGFPVAVVAYDYTVHAGTQSAVNHMKIDHLFDLAIRQRLPTVCWLEGGGARPHDLNVGVRGATQTFVAFAQLSGLAPTVGIVAGRAFAGNANLAGLCDVLIATPDAVLGMAGPPLVEAALGVKLTPSRSGPWTCTCARAWSTSSPPTSRPRTASRASTSGTSGPATRGGSRQTSRACASSSPRIRAGPTTCAASSSTSRTPTRCWS